MYVAYYLPGASVGVGLAVGVDGYGVVAVGPVIKTVS